MLTTLILRFLLIAISRSHIDICSAEICFNYKKRISPKECPQTNIGGESFPCFCVALYNQSYTIEESSTTPASEGHTFEESP